jgi:NitT/TauT family transport system substrate-binding protein
MKSIRWGILAIAAGAFVVGFATGRTAQAQQPKLAFGLPGNPPVYGAVVAYVARDAGFFSKLGVEVELRPFDSGAAAAQAVASGSIDVSLSPSAAIIRMTANAGTDLVGIHGLDNSDWLVGSMEPAKARCEDMKGQGVGVDSIGGARAIVLQQILKSCNLTLNDVQQVVLGTTVEQVMATGRLTFGVLHLDDVAPLERISGKKITVMARLALVNPDNHYLLLTVRRDNLAKKRDAFVRMVAGLMAAAKYMRDPAHADQVAEIAKPTGRNHDDAKNSLHLYNEMNYWAMDHAGMDRRKLEADAATQVKVGAIKAPKTPWPYDKLTDVSVFHDAMALLKGK